MNQIAQYQILQTSSIQPIYHMMDECLQQNPLSKTPAYVFGEKVVAPFLSKLASLFHRFDAVFTRAIGFLPQVKADDTGLIGWFDGECPKGWVAYPKLEGRAAVGAGTYQAVAEDGRIEKSTLQLGQAGGEIAHRIVEEEMPAHNHHFIQPDMEESDEHLHVYEKSYYTKTIDPNRLKLAQQKKNARLNQPQKESRKYTAIANQGKGNKHNNMPPYLALKACKKTHKNEQVEDIRVMKSEIESLQKTVEAQGSTVVSLKIVVSLLFGTIVGGFAICSRQFKPAKEPHQSKR